MSKPFKVCILFGDGADRPVDQIVPGWEMAEVPLSIMIQPFHSEAVWKKTKAQIKAWKLPPIRVASHFLSDFGLVATGPGCRLGPTEVLVRPRLPAPGRTGRQDRRRLRQFLQGRAGVLEDQDDGPGDQVLPA